MFPHIGYPLTQHKVTSQSKDLEIAMKLESYPIGESSAGNAQVQVELAALNIY
jgi:hypothetical protein